MEAYIGGFQEVSSTDYPNHVCSVVFLSGCNIRCRFCSNSECVEFGDKTSLEKVFNKIIKNMQLIDSVIISGGEPLIQETVVKEIIRWGKEKELLIGLETNGLYPEKLKSIIKELDFIAVDVKAPDSESFEKITGSKGFNKFLKTMELVKKNKVESEFRLTVTPSLHSLKDVLEINNLVKPHTLVLQRFQAVDTVLDKSLLEKTYPYRFEKILRKWSNRQENVILRFWD